MSSSAVPSTTDDACPLCETAVTSVDTLCPACGCDLVGFRTGPAFNQPLFWWVAMGFVVVYLVTLAVVAATR